jgi:hypothetical protein
MQYALVKRWIGARDVQVIEYFATRRDAARFKAKMPRSPTYELEVMEYVPGEAP